MTHGIRTTFDNEFDAIRQSLHQMSGMIDTAIDSALECFDGTKRQT